MSQRALRKRFLKAQDERTRLAQLRLSVDKVTTYATDATTGARRDRLLDDLGCLRAAVQGDIDHVDEQIVDMKGRIQSHMRNLDRLRRGGA